MSRVAVVSDATVEQFVAVTATDRAVAKWYIQTAGDLNAAVDLYFSGAGKSHLSTGQKNSKTETTPAKVEKGKRPREASATAATPAPIAPATTSLLRCHTGGNEKRLTRVRSIIDSTRLDRALSQRLFLVEVVKVTTGTSERSFKVLGSTGNVYTVIIGSAPSCSCPDFEKGNICKHILFVHVRVLQVPSSSPLIAQFSLIQSELSAIFDHADTKRVARNVQACQKVREAISGAATPKSTPKETIPDNEAARNLDGECPICFEALCDSPPVNIGDISVCATCSNGVHKGCMAKWISYNATAGTVSCPLCRSAFKRDKKSGPNTPGSTTVPVVNDEGYVNLGALQPGTLKRRDTSTYKATRWNGYGDDDDDDDGEEMERRSYYRAKHRRYD